MFRIEQAGFIAPQIKRFVIEAPRIARKHQAGQFVILRLHKRGERIPLTIESSNAERARFRRYGSGAGNRGRDVSIFEAAGRSKRAGVPGPDVANTCYKLLSWISGAEKIGPILMGMLKPVHVLQRGREVEEIVNIAAIAVVDAQETEAALDAELKADKTAKNAGMRTRRAQAAEFP